MQLRGCVAAASIDVRSQLCRAVFFTASSAAFPPFLSRVGSASAASTAAQAEPLAVKGKTVEKWVAKLRPAKINGKVVGDKGASGKTVVKVVSVSSAKNYLIITYKLIYVD
ncbi:unnamed protein product [Closterium sp. Naga37s-1]|nr:unnamed protein product [Closterium sp. Naga37s-1]